MIALTVSFLAIELLAYLKYHSIASNDSVHHSSDLSFDPVIGWRARRQFSGDTHHGGYPVPITLQTNADGFRDGDWDTKLERARKLNAKKILLLGDSVLYGWASAADERLSEQLAALYNLKGKSVEVFNSGIPGYGSSQEFRILPELLERIHPDIVVLLFYENDYGDTALPYDHRWPYRVYKPFYDINGNLILNEKIPKRPSLWAKETIFSHFYFWFALDRIYYFLQDLKYNSYDIPNKRNAPYPLHLYDNFFSNEDLKKRFPYVEKTVFSLLQKVNKMVQDHGARFFLAPTREWTVASTGRKLHDLGICFIPVPPETSDYWPWETILYDNHPNFLFFWFIANKIYAVLEDKPYQLNWRQLPQLPKMPTEIRFGDDRNSARYLYGDWWPSEKNGRWLKNNGRFILRNPNPSHSKIMLQITAVGNGRGEIKLFNEQNKQVCHFIIGQEEECHSCLIDTNHRDILFFQVVPLNFPGKEYPEFFLSTEERKSVFFKKVAILPSNQPQN